MDFSGKKKLDHCHVYYMHHTNLNDVLDLMGIYVYLYSMVQVKVVCVNTEDLKSADPKSTSPRNPHYDSNVNKMKFGIFSPFLLTLMINQDCLSLFTKNYVLVADFKLLFLRTI